MTLLALEDIDKRYAERQLLRGVSLHVAEGERVAIVGDNGTGKSTLLRILAGVEAQDAGRRTVRREVVLGYLPQEPEVDLTQRVRDVVRAGLGAWQGAMLELEQVHAALAAPGVAGAALERLLRRQAELDARIDQLGGHQREHEVEATILALGLRDPDASCATLSGGERRRVALARLLLAEPDVLLLDEPTNHLDAFAIDWLEDRLLAARSTLVLVTHDRYFLDRVVTRIVELDRGSLHSYDGAYGDFLVQRAERLAQEERAESSRLNLLRRETAWMRRGPPARTTKAKARIGRYHDVVSQAREAPAAGIEFAIPCGSRLGDRVLRLQGVTKGFAGRTLLAGLDLELGPGERLGIVGPNGAGKTTLLRVCTGELAPDSGAVIVGPTVRFSGIDQARSGLDPARTVLEEVGRDNDYVAIDGRMLRIESFLDSFGFTGARKHVRVGELSGGERSRVLLARLLAQGGNVLILDEPTNDLDLNTLRMLEESLLAFPGSALIVSHDRYFLDRVATRILHLDGAGRARLHEGDLSSFLARGGWRTAGGAEAKPAAAPAPARPVPAVRRLSTREREELERLPAQLAAAEAELARLDAALLDPALYTTPGGDPHRVARERAEAATRLDALMARWVELEDRAAAAGGRDP
ncbi:MAG: ATP-binding cassette domain-containing protein [Planctomycetes bacterium]|nr:ATP-binding cassette domain-containing protein [Planctomycetota bacterium]